MIAILIFVIKYGLGRIKNAKKLAAVRAELNQIELGVQAEGKAVVARVRAKL